jgi:hypothetical protein
VGLGREMSPAGGLQCWKPVLASDCTMLLCTNSANNILQVKLDNRQSQSHTPLQGRVAKPKYTQGLLEFVACHKGPTLKFLPGKHIIISTLMSTTNDH